MNYDINLKVSDVVSPYAVFPWPNAPGNWILNVLNSEKNKASVVYNNFVKNIAPKAVEYIKKLIDSHHVSAMHLPMTMNGLFFTYIHEQIELFQNQRNERDLEIDQKWQKFKIVFAKERFQIFTYDPKWAKILFEDIKTRLIDADVLGKDFDVTVSLWLQIISIVHIGDMHLVALFEKKVRRPNLFSPVSITYTDIPRVHLESVFYLTVCQLIQDLNWITPFIIQNMLFDQDLQSEDIFNKITGVSLSTTSKVLEDKLNALKMFLHDCAHLKFAEGNLPKSISSTLEQNRYEMEKIFPNVQIRLKELKDVRKDVDFLLVVQNKKIYCPKECVLPLIAMLENHFDCHRLIDCYLLSPFIGLERILESLQKSNDAIDKFKIDGIRPRLVDQCPSLLPVPSISQYDEKVYQELLGIQSIKPGNRRIKINGKGKQEPILSQEIPEKKTIEKNRLKKSEFKAIFLGDNVRPEKILSPLERLSEKLFKLCHVQPTNSLRQSLWHLDALMTIQQGIDTVKTEEGLTILNMTASSAQRCLEQTYRFCLENQKTTLFIHNLKDYHKTLYPPSFKVLNSSPFPDIVNQLYLANHWTRYFYIEQNVWDSYSTLNMPTPPLLDELVNLAEGTLFSKERLYERLKEIIEKTRLQVENLLLKEKIPDLEVFLPESVPIQLNVNIDLEVFKEVECSLKVFLEKFSFPNHHPANLYLKQGISSLSMLRGSLQRIQVAQTPQELATWISFSLQQMQEAIEDVLHGIEFFQHKNVTSLHELKELSSLVGLEMGHLGDACHQLSYKSRYPAENLSEGLGARIIDDIEAIRQYPDCIEGFKLVGSSKILWKMPSEDASLNGVVERLINLLADGEAFLNKQALPLLFKSV